MLNVLIADSHPVARAGLHMLVEHVAETFGDECLIAYSGDALTAIRKAKRLQPDLILLSSNLRLTGGVQTVLALRGYAPLTKLVILSDDDEEAVLRAYVDAGADGALCKRESPAAIEECISTLLREGGPRSADQPQVAAAPAATPAAPASYPALPAPAAEPPPRAVEPPPPAADALRGTSTKNAVPRPGIDRQRKS